MFGGGFFGDALGQIGSHDELPGGVLAQLVGGEFDQEGEVGVFLDVTVEVLGGVFDEEFFENDVPHGHGQRAVGPGGRCQPFIGELHVLGIVRADRDDFLAAVACFGHPVSIGRSGQWYVRAPHHQIAGVEPVTGFRNIGLITEDLG